MSLKKFFWGSGQLAYPFYTANPEVLIIALTQNSKSGRVVRNSRAGKSKRVKRKNEDPQKSHCERCC